MRGLLTEEHILTSTVPNKDGRMEGQGFEAFFQEHYAMVYRAAYSVTRSRQDAEDVLQTVFMKVLRRENQKEFAANVSRYLYRAAVNEALHVVRSRTRQPVVSDPECVERVAAPGASRLEDDMCETLN